MLAGSVECTMSKSKVLSGGSNGSSMLLTVQGGSAIWESGRVTNPPQIENLPHNGR